MKTLPDGLQAHLDSGATSLCWCWKLTRRDGEVFGFTDHDLDISFDGVTYGADSGFTASELQSSLGLSVDNVDVEGALSADLITEQDIALGLYDGAEIEVWRVNWQETSQAVLMRKGNLGEIKRGDRYFSAEIRGLAAQLQQKQGRVYQSGCDANLGDDRCGVDVSEGDYSASATVTGYTGGQVVQISGIDAFKAGWFNRGVLTFTSGENEGLSYQLQSHVVTSGIVTLGVWSSFLKDVAIGDTLELVAGCDKKFATCVKKFGNGENFRGCPHMPGNDYVMNYPTDDDAGSDGSTSYVSHF
ncbi:DUF2163 domain-containing protein [uncultured Cohaesibacter sp.]|uniref:DUF2163 domain-containing protein n=1 Tax=uncultured Cohaesibacter sp. TaxID=1002546 RepID=UPI0029C8A7D3|nr:DUF2163 domain-containing protein [uncultured Cohaesibacter sp.]